MDALRRLVDCTIIPQYQLLYNKADITSILFNPLNNYPITDQIYNLVWYWINQLIDAGCKDAIKNYWSLANQYYTFNLQPSSDEEQKSNFREFHIMIATLICYSKDYELLNYLLTFSNSLPPKYFLVPSTFISIIDTYKKLSFKNRRMYLLKYNIKGLYNGAGEENKIEGLLIDYLCLLLIRLNNVNNYNITYSDPFDTPEAETTVERNERMMEMIDFFKRKVKLWSKNNEALTSLGFQETDCENAISLLESYKVACKDWAETINSHPNISKSKKEEIKITMIEEDDKLCKAFPIGRTKKGKTDEFISKQFIMLDKNLILDGYDSVSSNLGEAIVNSLYIQMRQYYCYQFLINSPLRNYAIPYYDMGKAIDRLGISNDFTILSLGVSPHFFEETEGFTIADDGDIKFKGIKVKSIQSNQNSLLIMKTNDVPVIFTETLSDTERENEEEEISKNHLYSNIDNLSPSNLKLSAKIKFGISVPNPLRYVKMRIGYNMSSDDLYVNSIEPICNVIV